MSSIKEDAVGSLEVNNQSAKKTSGANISYWLDSTKPISYSPLSENINVDVAIVGGGIAGLTIAYLLSQKEYSVAVIEDGNIGSGETGRTTAHIVNALDDRYFQIAKDLGEDEARLAAESHTEAINFIERIVKTENIECDFERVDGYLFLHPSDEIKSLEDEHIAANKASLKTEPVTRVPGLAKNTFAVKFPKQAQFHPLKYLAGLCEIITKNGGRIFTGTHATDVDESGISTAKGFRADAKFIVVATNTPFNNRFVIHTKQAPYRTYVIGALVPKNKIPKALWWDTGDHDSEWPTYPYHYARLHSYDNTYDLLIVGGEDHKTGQPDEDGINPEERYTSLVQWTKENFPAVEEVIYRWSGQVMEPVDHLAFIGKNPTDPDNIFIVSGDSGNGITHGTLAGIIITDLISGIDNPWAKLYDPSRKSLSTIPTFIEEQVNVAKQYFDFLSKGDVETVRELGSGQGAIISSHMKKVAVYRDENGKLHAYSAVCPHLKCIIDWNSDEKTFDCPCHGSRFNALGKVINGPANKDLDEVGIPEESLVI